MKVLPYICIWEQRECHIICVNCPDCNPDFIELPKPCKGGNPCLDRIPAIRVIIIKQSMRIFRQFTYTVSLTKPNLPAIYLHSLIDKACFQITFLCGVTIAASSFQILPLFHFFLHPFCYALTG